MPTPTSKTLLAAARAADADSRRQAVMTAEQERQQPQPRPTSITPEMIHEAWSLISPAGHSVLTKSQILDNLRIFFPNLTAREVKDLVGAGNMSLDKLNSLLLNPEAPALDANAEAFKILDTQGVGYIDAGAIRKLLQQMPGIGKVDEADMNLVMQLCDADKDGRISLKDFATIGSWAPVKEVPTAATRKIMLEKLKANKGVQPLERD